MSEGLASSMRPTTPVTYGLAMLVPVMAIQGCCGSAKPLAAMMSVPGAAISGLQRPSRVGPWLLEALMRWRASSRFATAMMLCPQANDVMTAPFATSCVAGVNLGGARVVKLADGKTVEITVVPASHDSTVPRALLSDEERKHLEADNVSLQLGQPTGYVIRFSNGLVAYLTGDTGMFAEMKTTMADFHKVNLIELNLGYSALNAPAAAHIVNDLVKPSSVLLSHVNEGATTGGKMRPGSRTAAFTSLVKGVPVYPALSGKTMQFDGAGKCVAGC